MNFECIHRATSEWLKLHPEFQLIMADETEDRFEFTCKNTELSSFFVICGRGESGKWKIGSDVDKVLPHLACAKSYCSCHTDTKIEDILDCLSKELLTRKDKDCDENDEDDGDGDDDDDYDSYSWEHGGADDDDGDQQKTESRPVATRDEEMEEAYQRFSGAGSSNSLAVSRLIKDMVNLKKSAGQFGISGKPRGDNLFTWDVQLTDIPTDSLLGEDLKEYARRYSRQPVIDMEMVFPANYPMCPPFVQIVRPRFQFLTGHITIGGSICMQSLTKSGWSPSNDIESILVQIRATILSDPNVRLCSNAAKEYTSQEAKDAFDRMVTKYGWDK